MPDIKEMLEKYKRKLEYNESLELDGFSEYGALEYLDKQVKNHPKETLECFGTSAADFFGIDFFLEAITKMRESGEDVEPYLKDIILDMEQVDTLLKLKDVPEGINADIVCRSAADISIADLDNLESKIKINTIGFRDINVYRSERNTYDATQYRMCREILDILLSGVKFPPKDEKNREKKIWGQVMKTLAIYIKAHNHQLEDEDGLSEEEKEKIARNDRNMIGGLLNRECVCVGYAEIMRNAMLCCGIEARIVGGMPKDESRGHSWNQVKLDGEWFNMDLTWARNCIARKKPIGFLLASDQDFNDGFVFDGSLHHSHKNFSERKYYREEKCKRTVPLDETWAYLDPSYKMMLERAPEVAITITYREWLKRCARQTRMGKIKDVARTLIRDMKRGKERRNVNDKEQSDR